MEILFVGDLVGEEAAEWLAHRVPGLREELGLDHVVVNAENVSVTGPRIEDGFGITVRALDKLLMAGVDVVTGGNHSWDGPEVADVLAHPLVARPHNVESSVGRGVITVGSGDRTLTVVNLLSPSAAPPATNAPVPSAIWPAWRALTADGALDGTVLVDLHGDSGVEKAAFAAAIDGEVAAVLGTHTHDPSLRTHLLDGGTGYVAEVGMTGRLGNTGLGFDNQQLAAAIRGEDLDSFPPFRLSTGPLALGAIHVSTVDETGHCVRLSRIERQER